jgi:subtilisin-like proprotein convertase family protein
MPYGAPREDSSHPPHRLMRRLTASLAGLAVCIAAGVASAPAPAGLQGVLIFYDNKPVAIPNGQGSARMTFEDNGQDDTGGVSVGVRVRHERTQQLEVSVRGPNGTSVELTQPGDTRGENLGTGRCLDDEYDSAQLTYFADFSSNDIGSATAPYAGTFQPRQALSAFTSPIPEGRWRVIVKDTQGGAEGKLMCAVIRVPYDPS